MNILMDIAHPAHVHLLRNTYFELVEKGHNVFVTVKDIPAAIILLDRYQIPYIHLGGKRDSLVGKAILQFKYNFTIWKLVNTEKIDIGFCSSMTITHISRISRKKSVLLDDDDDKVEPRFGGALVEHGRFICVNNPVLYRLGEIAVRIMKNN